MWITLQGTDTIDTVMSGLLVKGGVSCKCGSTTGLLLDSHYDGHILPLIKGRNGRGQLLVKPSETFTRWKWVEKIHI